MIFFKENIFLSIYIKVFVKLKEDMALQNFKGAYRTFNSRDFVLKKHIIVRTMTSSIYENAVAALNGLQSNFVYLQKARTEKCRKPYKNLSDTQRHLEALHITLKEIDSLNIIHVAGTKGKGSTCAFTECVLRKHGYKTGFYSSPHLISVNERIRINGAPLPKDKFAAYFWEVYNSIQCNLKEDEHMPSYFLFLTVMAFYVFVKEQVEAAIIEVGIGGLYDCTNIVRKPIAVGITTLGIDHVSILGNTITEIAEQKAGILKKGVPAFTVPQQENAMIVLRKKARSIGCPMALSPPLESYECKISLGVQGIVQNVNASLALQLSHCWLTSHKCTEINSLSVLDSSFEKNFPNEESNMSLSMADAFYINSKTQNALENCIWPGRFQTIEKHKVTFYLDGAHTQQSMRYCKRWFEELSEEHRTKYNSPVLRVLLFNCTGERKAENLLDPLADIHFDVAFFSPNKIAVIKDTSSDLSNFMVDPQQEIQQCEINNEIWCHLMRSIYENRLSMVSSVSNCISSKIDNSSEFYNTMIFPSISDALNFLTSTDMKKDNIYNNETMKLVEVLGKASHIQVLVTGSLHLVGGVLSLIQA